MNTQNEHSQTDTKWIEKLALEELNMENSGVINFNEHLSPQAQLEDASIEFMESLRELFDIYTHKFNQLRSQNTNHQHIKIFKISNTINDFMIFRNSLKLVVARRSVDVISIGFLSSNGSPFGARMGVGESAGSKIQEIKAHLGPFNEITWRYHGEEVKTEALVRHYLTEFIKFSSN